MADGGEWTASGFDETSLGYNYIKLSLSLLAVSAKMSADLAIDSFGATFAVTLGGDYATKLGPAISGTVWMGSIGSFDYAAAGSETVTIDGNPLTLQAALVKHENAASSINAVGAKLAAALKKKATRATRTSATATRAVTSANRNRLGARVSTGGSS